MDRPGGTPAAAASICNGPDSRPGGTLGAVANVYVWGGPDGRPGNRGSVQRIAALVYGGPDVRSDTEAAPREQQHPSVAASTAGRAVLI